MEKQGKTVQKEPILSMRASELERIKSEAREEAVDTAMVLLLGISIKVLRDKCGWVMKIENSFMRSAASNSKKRRIDFLCRKAVMRYEWKTEKSC